MHREGDNISSGVSPELMRKIETGSEMESRMTASGEEEVRGWRD